MEANWKRALADYHNLLKRAETEKKEVVKFASSNIIMKLLPTLDILEMAADHSNDPGVKMAVNQFHQVLVEEGLQQIVPQVGDEFNHAWHECTEVVQGEPEGTIAQTVAKGYKIDDYVIRPAKVKVWAKS